MKKTFYVLTAVLVAGASAVVVFKNQAIVAEALTIGISNLVVNNLTEAGNERNEEVGALVLESIAEDQRAIGEIDQQIVRVQDKMRNLSGVIERLSSEKSKTNQRIAKYNGIAGVLSVEKKATKEEPATLVESESRKFDFVRKGSEPSQKTEAERSAPVRSAISRLNSQLKETVASVTDGAKFVTVSLEGRKFLREINNQTRVSAEKSALLVPVFETLKNTREIAKILIRAGKGASPNEVNVLKKYFRSQYGLNAEVVEDSTSANSIRVDINSGT